MNVSTRVHVNARATKMKSAQWVTVDDEEDVELDRDTYELY